MVAVSYTHLRAHETPEHLVCRLLEKVIDLLNPARKRRPIVLRRIERLDDRLWCLTLRHYFETTVALWRLKAALRLSVGSGGLSSAAKKAA